ncbi:hypothetical protein B0T16DRAFT_77672 [Cercophora newfieldiana]|uniref:Myb-like DNA-binding domain-containing protein n=1 Tax=Cercophora newfieldiana TaxID=92897 RepID=A0AA39YEW0_9PEZI|nr:hypothetical protein B0T16DRAFT_77672 [Cercophora newfieldiana]
MSANDNAMTRFLFAILQQKDLKDVDWNKVAHDPVLAQEITNGHAARMRYSRFRAAMLGIEPQRRNRTNQNRNRVTKKKKDDNKAKKGSPAPDGDKSDADTSPVKREGHTTTEGSESVLAPKVKEERLFMPGAPSPLDAPSQQQPATFSADHRASTAMSEMQARLQMRLLTPCSDSDILAATQGFAHSPPSDMLHSDTTSFDFIREASAPVHHHTQHTADSVANQWHHQNPYSPFGLGVNMGYGSAVDGECYTNSPFADHQDHGHGHHHHGAIVVPDELALMEHHHEGVAVGTGQGQQQVVVKHEEWDASEQGHGYH